jgi:serine/threonine-protein kinase
VGTTPGKLRRKLQRDLDIIVAKTLKKNAAERYASVTALADDLRQDLCARSRSARGPTPSATGPRCSYGVTCPAW